MVAIVTYENALDSLASVRKRHLLLGNGFSIALKPDIFSYGSLYDNADFSSMPYIKTIFEALRTEDFEVVIKHLQDAATVLEVYRPRAVTLARSLRRDALAIKDALVKSIAKHHPDRPFDIEPIQYAACRIFVSKYDHIFTLNYDVLLYWALMQDDVDDIFLRHDDGFRHPEDNPDVPWVSWQQANSATVSYLHGALHLFDAGSEITKYTWSKTDKPIIEQIRAALADEKYPLFVAEGESKTKRQRILHNGYLHKALRSFEQCCASSTAAIVVFGHSLAANDRHVLRCIARGGCSDLVVSLFGNPDSKNNRSVVANALSLQSERERIRGKKLPLRVTFYDAASAKVWG